MVGYLALLVYAHTIHLKLFGQISQKLYEPFIKEVFLFKGCSTGFIKQIVKLLSWNWSILLINHGLG
ncbi:hypothetical protein Gogos_021758 [Gossypium gossypioides]|uniref:Uncharacterized protein n=1 Tax=Gossypium gossypioides TaxID=34282 RepID=A0A7J9D6T5_GOSGO|nr:hypothetical protein [Gossypium gossypioides]